MTLAVRQDPLDSEPQVLEELDDAQVLLVQEDAASITTGVHFSAAECFSQSWRMASARTNAR